MALALNAIIGGGFSRLGYGRRIAIVGATAAGVRLLGFLFQSGAEDEVWLNLGQYLTPLAATWIALAQIFRGKINRHIDITRRPANLAPYVGARA